jgi:hypothetical protein
VPFRATSDQPRSSARFSATRFPTDPVGAPSLLPLCSPATNAEIAEMSPHEDKNGVGFPAARSANAQKTSLDREVAPLPFGPGDCDNNRHHG